MTPAFRHRLTANRFADYFSRQGAYNLFARWSFRHPRDIAITSASFSGTGTATSTLNSTALVGVGTSFLGELAAGDTVYTNADVLIGTIASVTDNTNAVLTANAATAITGAAFKIVKYAPRITQANDISGNGNHLVMASAFRQPLFIFTDLGPFGLPYALFDGVDDVLKAAGATLNQPESVYITLFQVTRTNVDAIYDGNVTDGGGCIQNSVDGQLSIYAGTSGIAAQGALATKQIHTGIFNGASSMSRINRNAGVTGNAGANNMSGFTLGSVGTVGTRHSNIRVWDVAVYQAIAHPQNVQDRTLLAAAQPHSLAI